LAKIVMGTGVMPAAAAPALTRVAICEMYGRQKVSKQALPCSIQFNSIV
jgi:hypothetical protein